MLRDSSRELSTGSARRIAPAMEITAIRDLEQLRGQAIEQDEAAELVEKQTVFFHIRDKAADHGS
jgi:hypothetical protein